jgi:hypothetical protein
MQRKILQWRQNLSAHLRTWKCPACDVRVSRIFWVYSLITVSVANNMASVTNESVGIIDEMIRTWEDYQKFDVFLTVHHSIELFHLSG